MSQHHLIVYRRDNAWQFTYRGTITAPFISREEAVAAAIIEARALADDDIKVVVQNTDMTEETVWRAGDS